MRDSDYYPPGAYNDPDAPYNEIETPEYDFSMIVSQTLAKSTEVTTDKYIYTREEDEEGPYVSRDTDDTDWKEVYQDNGLHTPLQLIQLFSEFLKEQSEKGVFFKSERFTKDLISECEDWEEDDSEYYEN